MPDVSGQKLTVMGVDPSLAGTGLAVLDIEAVRLRGRPELAVEVLAAQRVPTKASSSLAFRVEQIARAVRHIGTDFARAAWADGSPFFVAVEDVTSFKSIPGMKRKQRDIAVGGVALGAALAAIAAMPLREPVALLPLDRWLPKRRGAAFAKHERVRDYMRARWPALRSTSDDVTFAAGLALFFAWERLVPGLLNVWGSAR